MWYENHIPKDVPLTLPARSNHRAMKAVVRPASSQIGVCARQHPQRTYGDSFRNFARLPSVTIGSGSNEATREVSCTGYVIHLARTDDDSGFGVPAIERRSSHTFSPPWDGPCIRYRFTKLPPDLTAWRTLAACNLARYSAFSKSGTKDCGLRTSTVPRLRRILFRLQEAAHPASVNAPSFRPHPQKDEREDQWSVSGNWRVVFRFEDGEAVAMDLIDYH